MFFFHTIPFLLFIYWFAAFTLFVIVVALETNDKENRYFFRRLSVRSLTER